MLTLGMCLSPLDTVDMQMLRNRPTGKRMIQTSAGQV